MGPRWGNEKELTFNIQNVDLLETITQNAIKSIILQVDIEKLTLETINEIHNLFITDVTSQAYKEAQQKASEGKKSSQNLPDEQPNQNEVPLHFMLYDTQGNHVRMFSRTCKIRKSRELYEYFENNDAVKMKIEGQF